MIAGACYGFKHIFFSSNDFFILKNYDIHIKGTTTERDVAVKLDRIIGNESNLFAIDLADVRKEMEGNIFIEKVELSRKIPDTLTVNIIERFPVAQLMLRGKLLLGSEGFILPVNYQNSKNLLLPIIAGIRNREPLKVGDKTNHKMILHALEFLKLIRIRPYGRWFDVSIIQVSQDDILKVHLRKKGFIKNDCVIVLPVKTMERGLLRVLTILKERNRAKQYTSFIDSSYSKNVPVRP